MEVNAKELENALKMQLGRNSKQLETFKAKIEYHKKQIAECDMEIMLREANVAELNAKLEQIGQVIQTQAQVQPEAAEAAEAQEVDLAPKDKPAEEKAPEEPESAPEEVPAEEAAPVAEEAPVAEKPAVEEPKQ